MKKVWKLHVKEAIWEFVFGQYSKAVFICKGCMSIYLARILFTRRKFEDQNEIEMILIA